MDGQKTRADWVAVLSAKQQLTKGDLLELFNNIRGNRQDGSWKDVLAFLSDIHSEAGIPFDTELNSFSSFIVRCQTSLKKAKKRKSTTSFLLEPVKFPKRVTSEQLTTVPETSCNECETLKRVNLRLTKELNDLKTTHSGCSSTIDTLKRRLRQYCPFRVNSRIKMKREQLAKKAEELRRLKMQQNKSIVIQAKMRDERELLLRQLEQCQAKTCKLEDDLQIEKTLHSKLSTQTEPSCIETREPVDEQHWQQSQQAAEQTEVLQQQLEDLKTKNSNLEADLHSISMVPVTADATAKGLGDEVDSLKSDSFDSCCSLEGKEECRRRLITEKIMESDATVLACTGVPNATALTGLFEILKDRAPQLKYWRGEKHSFDEKEKTEEERRGRKRVLTLFEEMLLTLCRLRLGLTCYFLGLLFGVSTSHVSSVFTTWISLMADTFREQIKMSSLSIVKRSMPATFRAKFSNVRAVIDCTEFFVQKPKTPTAQHKLYSQYKSHTTCKALISITPDGCINFVSKLYGGNASDRYITKDCGILDLLEAGDAIMADRGFLIRDLCLLKKAHLIIPPFTRAGPDGKRRLNREEIQQTRDIARVRIHVERAIERIKNFKMFSQIMPLTLKSTADEMLIVTCFLCNMLPPLMVRSK